jgi:hypothetical protein
VNVHEDDDNEADDREDDDNEADEREAEIMNTGKVSDPESLLLYVGFNTPG